jgi:gliding motility-associated-like protein
VFVGFYDDADTNALALTYRYEGAGQYAVTLIAKNDLGCTDTITKRFYLVGDLAVLDMPNTFSPNNDGLNDLFIYDLAGYDEHTIWIYDRWGRQVFTNGGDITRFWDGRNADGTMMPEGVFTYKLIAKRLRANEIREVSGTITVLR